MSSNKKIIFWGTPQFSLPALIVLHQMGLVKAVVTQASKAAGRGRKLLDSPVKIWAEKNDLPVLAYLKLDNNFVDELKKYLPATFVIVAYGKIIKKEVLDLSELPAINIHPSKLPDLRGPSPIQTALLLGYKKTAVTLMQLDEKMDHGPILAQIDVNISDSDDFLSLSDKLSKIGAQLLEKNINQYLNHEISSQEQDDSIATTCHMIEKEDGQIDWNENSDKILNKIRAFNPWPSAYTKLLGYDMKIHKAKNSHSQLKAGEVLIDKIHLLVGCADQAIEILELQVAGKKIVSAADFIRGLRNKN